MKFTTQPIYTIYIIYHHLRDIVRLIFDMQFGIYFMLLDSAYTELHAMYRNLRCADLPVRSCPTSSCWPRTTSR